MASGESLTKQMYSDIAQQMLSHSGGVQEAWEV